jgi:hypothetical protein
VLRALPPSRGSSALGLELRLLHDVVHRHEVPGGLLDAGLGLGIGLRFQAPGLAAEPEDDSARVLGVLEAAFDPHGILAPGRYLP